ncbi:serine/threonine-protein kinase Nek9-like [Patiria miniata]|uniref:non-specific serine/threonine protein kinase n=1 Tax=Patiria miniata TaxID=46514 RepID=A0A914BHW3_PATMI|nr:serine/threonine-protein kinase Nek9-like [Patiria miniata]
MGDLSTKSNASSVSESAQEERYNHVKVLGKGAFGEAVLYNKTEDNSLVVWKEINLSRATDKDKRDAQNEIEILSMLNHANIITYYNHFVDESSLFIEMEYANDGTLYQKIVDQKTLFKEEDVVWYLFQIVSAIDHIHGNGILHRDIKTLNIFLTKQNLIKLGDFGISKVLKNTDVADTVVGTPYYMSPEIMRGQQYDTKSDMWATGCVLYELLTLKRSFDASNRLKLVWGIVQNDIETDSLDARYSSDIKTLVGQLLSKDPEKRPSAAEVLRHPVIQAAKENMEKRVWTLNASARKARIASSTAAETIPIVTSKTSEVYCWGGGRLTPKKLEEFTTGNAALQVSAGNVHFAAVTVEKELFTWANVQGGQPLVGQLGHGDKCFGNPKRVDSLQNVKAVSCGEEFTACITDDGELYTFGSDYYGCLGCDNAEGDEVNQPIPVDFFSGKPVEQVSCGECHIVALTKDREVYSWGCGEFGRLGLGSEDDHSLPQKVYICGNKTIRSVCAGFEGTFFVTTDGKVLACGSNENNKLGFNTFTKGLRKRQVKENYDIPWKDIPAIVKPLNRYHITSVSTGKDHSAVIDDTGRLITFGLNKHGQLGVGDCKERSGVSVISGLLSSKQVLRAACGDGFTVVATKDNQIYSFGNVDSGRLGIPVDPSLTHRKKMAVPTPKPIFGALHFVSDISCRHWHCIVIVEKVLKMKTIRSPYQDSFTSSRGVGVVSQISSEPSQDDSVFTSESFDTDNADIEGVVTHDEEEPDGLGVTGSSVPDSGMGDDSMPPWLAVELQNAEFIPMQSKNEAQAEPANQAVSDQHNSDEHPTHNLPAGLPPAMLSSSNNQKSLNASSISVGLAASQAGHGLPPSVPPLCLDGLSGSGDSLRLQMIRDRERDGELEALNQRVVHLEAENKTLQQRVAEQDAKIQALERQMAPILRRDQKFWRSFGTWEKECRAANSMSATQQPLPLSQKARRVATRSSSLVVYPTHKHKPTYDYESIVHEMIGRKGKTKKQTSGTTKKVNRSAHRTEQINKGPTKKYMHQYVQTELQDTDDHTQRHGGHDRTDRHPHRPGYKFSSPKRVLYRPINIDNPQCRSNSTIDIDSVEI